MSNIESQNVEATETEATEATVGIIGEKKSVDAIKAALGGSRKVFDSFEDAIAKVEAITAKLAEIGETTQIPVIAAGVGDLAKVESMDDPKLKWADGTYKIALGYLGLKRPKEEGGMAARALVLYPVPTVEQYIESDAGNDWLTKIATKETGHVAYRSLRNVPVESGVEALYQTAERIPTTAAEFAEEQRAAGLDTSAFDAVWKHLRADLVKAYNSLRESLPAKGEVINCIRSKSYAVAEYPDLEENELFEFIGKIAIELVNALEDDDLDVSEIEAWLQSRDSLNIPPKERKQLETKLDLSAFKIA